MDNLIDKLKDMGFNTYEAKVYLALLKHHPATGYEISKESGVPQARAYDTLKALETSGVVSSLGGKPVTYMPQSPEVLLEKWERDFKSSISYLKDILPSMSSETVEPVVNMRGEEAIFSYTKELIGHAKKNIFLEIWKEDAEKLREPMKIARERGVDIRIVGYDNVDMDFCDVYQHGLAAGIEKSLGGRYLIMSVDDQEGIVGMMPGGSDRMPQAVYTRNPGIVLIIKELVVHDIFLLDVEEHLKDEIEHIYGRNLMALRQKILGDESPLLAHH